jgi:hypothetical protein
MVLRTGASLLGFRTKYNNNAPFEDVTRPRAVAHSCGYLDITYQHTESPCVMTTEVLDIRPGFSHPPKLVITSLSSRRHSYIGLLFTSRFIDSLQTHCSTRKPFNSDVVIRPTVQDTQPPSCVTNIRVWNGTVGPNFGHSGVQESLLSQVHRKSRLIKLQPPCDRCGRGVRPMTSRTHRFHSNVKLLRSSKGGRRKQSTCSP